MSVCVQHSDGQCEHTLRLLDSFLACCALSDLRFSFVTMPLAQVKTTVRVSPIMFPPTPPSASCCLLPGVVLLSLPPSFVWLFLLSFPFGGCPPTRSYGWCCCLLFLLMLLSKNRTRNEQRRSQTPYLVSNNTQISRENGFPDIAFSVIIVVKLC